MRIIEVEQGSQAWAAERARRFTASEAPAMMGASKYTTRAALLAQKHTGLAPEVSPAQQALFDRGHAAEAAARALLEAELGDLYPVTAVHDTDDRLLASVDGMTFDEATLFEHKLFSEQLAEQVQAGELEPHYYWQMEHQLLVTGAERVIFVTSDGTRERWAQMEYRPVPGRREQLLAGWEQFARDLAAYVPPEPAAPAAVAQPMESLPAVSVKVDGALAVTSNLDLFGRMLRDYVAKIPKAPSTDQEFADTDAACKALKKAEEALDAAESNALAQISTVEQLQRTVADLRKLARDTRLASEKLVKARKEQLRAEAVQRGRAALIEHVAGLNAGLGRPYLPAQPENFAVCISGLKSLDSIRNAIDTELARCKIAANEQAEVIRANLRHLQEHASDYKHLFPDTAQLVLKPAEVVQAVVSQRIAEHRAAEERRIEAERERIRAEEAARLEREQREREDAERRQREAAEAEQRQQAQAAESARQAAQAPASTPTLAPAANDAPATVSQAAGPAVIPMPTKVPAGPPTLRLGVICERLGFKVTADDLAAVGIHPAGKDRAAVLFHEHQWPQVLDALIEHLQGLRAACDQREAA